MAGHTALVAIGGNALLAGGDTATIAEQFDAARQIAAPLRDMIRAGWRVVLTHGNGLKWASSSGAPTSSPQ